MWIVMVQGMIVKLLINEYTFSQLVVYYAEATNNRQYSVWNIWCKSF